MVQAPPEITVSPKELGKHLRTIRRKKGLSLSEVARGAGLSRRELVAYERGKVPIPESDLWVLAGSCGVDVSELVPSTSARELAAAADATSIGDTVSQLRRSQEDAGITPYLHTLQKLQALPPGKRIPVKERELEEIATALGSTPRSIDQRLQEVLHVSPDEAERLRTMILVPPTGRKKPRALAAAPTPVAAPTPPPASAVPLAPPEPAEPVQTLPVAPAAFLDAPLDAPFDPVHGHNVDVFEELARLPEPVPLGDPSAPLPDMLASHDPFAASPLVPVPAPPEGAVELVDNSMPATNFGSTGDTTPPVWDAADAPPIDVAMRQGSAIWDLGEPPLVPPTTTPDPESWSTDGWQPPAPDGANGHTGFWEGTDEWAPAPTAAADTGVDDARSTSTDGDDSLVEAMPLGESTWAGSSWDAEPWAPEASTDTGVADVNPWMTDQWPQEPADRGAWDHRPDPAAVDTGFYVDWGTDDAAPPPASSWDVFSAAPATVEDDATAAFTEPDADVHADVTDDGADLFASWSPTTEIDADDRTDAPPAWESAFVGTAYAFDPSNEPELADAPSDVDDTTLVFGADPADETADGALAEDPPVEVTETQSATTVDPEPGYMDVFVVGANAETVVELAPISWRADGEEAAADATEASSFEWITHDETAATFEPEPVVDAETTSPWIDAAWTDPSTIPEPVPEPEPEAEPEAEGLEFVTAGPDWQLGNALPLVEVRGQGALVMRRADERWALADVTTPADFVVEAEVDFRSGPGLGVLFRASVDDEGRMSGYSFDIDPIYDGGGYLVRQWQADRELWNPIARVSGDDPNAMYGTLLVRLVVDGEHLSASVNGVEVLTVENLKQASADRGRDAATGDRVGVQAWSSSDLVIDTVRVAAR